jgi:heptosyltransferase-1
LWSEKRFLSLAKSVFSFRRELRRRHFDLVVDLQGLLKSGIWSWLSGARKRIGLGSREGSQYLMHAVIDRHGGRRERIASEYLQLAESLGLEADDFPMHVAIGNAARAQAGELLAETVGGESYGVICPFTTRPQKHWIESHWTALVPRLHELYGMPVVMLGGPGDVPSARAIAAAGAADLVGKTSIQAAAAIIAGARYVIGVDTGLTHIGLALQRPTLCLFGSTRPYTDTATPRGRVLYHDMPCVPCRRRPTCNGRFDCMRALTPRQVLDALAEIMEARG